MPQGYNNSTLLGEGSGSSSGSGSFSSMLGLPQPGKLGNEGSYATEPSSGGWEGKTGAQLQNTATASGNMGLNNLKAASAALGLPLNYWAALLSGNPQAAMQAEAPAVNSVLAQYDTARRATANLSPRGGGQIAAETQAPFSEAGTISNLLSTAQSTAAQGITQNAALLGSIGQGETSTATSSLNDILNLILGQENFGLARNAQQNQQGQQAGQAVAQILPLLLGA